MNYCRKCNCEIPEGRYLCDECKEKIRQNKAKTGLKFSPNNKHVLPDNLLEKILLSCGSAVAVTIIILMFYIYFF